MQPYFLPYISYFQLINAVDMFVIYDDVNYINKGWINRNYYLSDNNKQLFTLPLLGASQNKKINEIDLFEFDKFKKNFLKGIELTYKKSPYYQATIKVINDILNYNGINLSEFIFESLQKINSYLSITTILIPSSSIYQNTNLKAQERIIDICKKEQATHYINPIGGVELYAQEKFEAENLNLKFIKTGNINYRQTSEEYTPYLSMIDTMMFNSVDEIKKLLLNYELVKN